MRSALHTTGVGETERGYRRGVVMGLTMAEIMLLFVFCLLLVAAGMVSARDTEIKKTKEEARVAEKLLTRGGGDQSGADVIKENVTLTAENERLLTENTRLRQVVLTTPLPQKEKIPEDTWRELELTREIASAAREQGVSLSEVREGIEAGKFGETILIGDDPMQPPFQPGHEWPPIIMLGSDKFRFQTNSAELTPAFREHLQTVTADQVQQLLDQYEVDVIEVVGHTDESPIASTQDSTMDALAIDAIHGKASVEDLVPVDNAGLGLARAIAVVHALEETELGKKGIKMIPLSAAQLVLPGDRLSDGGTPEANQSRRRIEIRVRRSTPVESEQ